jgi:hypothetical protein
MQWGDSMFCVRIRRRRGHAAHPAGGQGRGVDGCRILLSVGRKSVTLAGYHAEEGSKAQEAAELIRAMAMLRPGTREAVRKVRALERKLSQEAVFGGDQG